MAQMPEPASANRCPACASGSSHLLDWEFSGLGDSVFNYIADFSACPACGLVYVGNVSDAGLSRFYNEECSYFEKAHFAITSPANRKKYSFYSRFLAEQGVASVPMADVGCGRGGFVTWLAQDGWEQECYGVDVDVRSLPADLETQKRVSFRNGSCLDLPFANSTLGLLTYFHVLEHIRNLRGLLAESARVLDDNGYILIEVPDAEHYSGTPIGSAFWFSIREHINHFTAKSLAAALETQGFTVLTVSRQMLETPEFAYPSLMVLGQKRPALPAQALPGFGDVAGFARLSRQALMRQAGQIGALAADRPLTMWGCSSELFSVLPLLHGRKIKLCDSSKLKQRTHYKGMPIEDPAAVPVEGLLVVAPYLHRAEIKAAAERLGWSENAIYQLE
jgi:2-polyprenyl-3-methyl-5-hydroxy-6-metoxy-1,4-benzoquinol methylase